jgi:tripartite-type tricarboxylate transporter receptor subunit TctC
MCTALRAAILAALALAFPGEALAQAVCPENVIRIIVPFPPGWAD